MLQINNLTKKFKEKTVLNGLRLMVDDGSVFGLVGINGAGKSTLLRCISAVYQPDDGEILFNGRNTYHDVEVREEIFFVSDDFYFPNNSTIKSLKTFYETFYHLDEEEYHHYLKVFRLNENAQISTFSKGMKRQTGLLFAIAIKPKLLLLDECFDGLDPLVRLTFKKALVELIENRDITVIISSHNLKELEDICDSFGILENGQINTYGDLLKSKENVTKFQLAFSEDRQQEDFSRFDILNFRKEGMVYTLVIKGDRQQVHQQLAEMNPLLLNELSVNFEELFIYEVESRGLLNE